MTNSKSYPRRVAMACALAVALANTSVGATAAEPARSPASTALQDGDVAKLVADFGLVESTRAVRDMPGWTKPTKAVVFVDGNPGRAAWLQKAVPDVNVVAVRSAKEAIEQIADADILIGDCRPEQLLKTAKKLRYFHYPHGGMDRCANNAELLSGRMLVTNAQRVHGPVMAQHAIAMTLALYRGLDLYVRQNKDGRFAGGPEAGVPGDKLRSIEGRTMLVVGLGGIGTPTAKLAHAIGMRVIATRNSSREGPEYVDYVGLADELPALIGQADVVVMSAPLTPATTRLFDAAMFARMKKGALFINLGRGEQVVQDDLLAALVSGHLGGAGLDATAPEPLPPGYPLYNAPNIIITPHISAHATDDDGTSISGFAGEPQWQIARENLRRYAAGERVFSVVDFKRGY